MIPWLRPRRSAVIFDVGAAGVRACQIRGRSGAPSLCDVIQFDGTPSGAELELPTPTPDPVGLHDLLVQGAFTGDEVALIVSPPEVEFFPLRLPDQALRQAPERVEQALKWEVAQESRSSAEELEVRHWVLPPQRGQPANVMAVVMPTHEALQWHDLLAQECLALRRIDVSPCALVRLGCCFHAPSPQDVWGVLDLGLRHTTLTVVVGQTPTYIRALSLSAHQWTQALAGAFEVSYAVAEQLKREHGILPTDRGVRASGDQRGLLEAADLPSALSGVLREPLGALAHEVSRCFAYVLQNMPDQGVQHLLLAGGGAELAGLAGVLQQNLGVPVHVLTNDPKGGGPAWEHPLPRVRVTPRTAAVVGAALLDLEAA